jgi:hypothetical protein
MLGIQKFWREIIIAILVGLIIALLNSNGNLSVENAKLEGLVMVNESVSNLYMSQIHDRDKKIKVYITKIDSMNRVISSSESRVVYINKERDGKLSSVSKYSVSQSAEYFKSRYKTQDVKVSSDYVMIKDTVSKMCISDLVSGDYARAELKITKSVVGDLKLQSRIKDTVISELEMNRKTLDQVVSIKDSTISLKDQIIGNTQKQLKKEKRNKTLYKITTVATMAAGGYLLIR